MKDTWSIQDAKNKFSAVVDAAQTNRPQLVTRRGKLAAVVISPGAYEQQLMLQKTLAPGFKSALLEMPRDDVEFERPQTPLRNFDW